MVNDSSLKIASVVDELSWFSKVAVTLIASLMILVASLLFILYAPQIVKILVWMLWTIYCIYLLLSETIFYYQNFNS